MDARNLWSRGRIVGPAVAATAVAVGELAHWQASRALPPARPLEDGTTGLIVLGFPARRNGAPHPVQRWRVAIAERTWQQVGRRDLIVFSGGANRGRPISEAKTMVDLALDQRWLDPDGIVDPTVVELEERSASTWENIAFSLPLVEHCDQIAIVSDAVHAGRAADYAAALRPDLADRLVVADAHRFGEAWWIKPLSLLVALRRSVASLLIRVGDQNDGGDHHRDVDRPPDPSTPPNSSPSVPPRSA